MHIGPKQFVNLLPYKLSIIDIVVICLFRFLLDSEWYRSYRAKRQMKRVTKYLSKRSYELRKRVPKWKSEGKKSRCLSWDAGKITSIEAESYCDLYQKLKSRDLELYTNLEKATKYSDIHEPETVLGE